LTYANWEVGGARPAPTSEKDLQLFKIAGPIIVNDAYGKGEILFARKFSDDAGEMVAKIDQTIRDKEQLFR
jgi:hypothetical protein